MERIWTFKTANFTVELAWEDEPDPDLSWADEETLEKLDDGIWVNACFRVLVTGPNGEELGSSYLGNSIYENVEDFRTEHLGLAAMSRAEGVNYGSYFPGMVKEAIKEARGVWNATPRPMLRQSID
jgi:hypothetical protein